MSYHPIIAGLKAALESEREKDAEQFYKQSNFAPTEWAVMNFKSGHEAATERLMPLIEKTLEVIEFYGNEDNWDDYNMDAQKAREFLTNVSEFVADTTTLADASGESEKENE